jgi:hypothetical protein
MWVPGGNRRQESLDTCCGCHSDTTAIIIKATLTGGFLLYNSTYYVAYATTNDPWADDEPTVTGLASSHNGR